jgi:hypothetical protein
MNKKIDSNYYWKKVTPKGWTGAGLPKVYDKVRKDAGDYYTNTQRKKRYNKLRTVGYKARQAYVGRDVRQSRYESALKAKRR